MYVDITVLCFICINFREKNAGQKSIWKTEKNRIYNQKSDYCFGENFFFFFFLYFVMLILKIASTTKW